MRRRPLRLPSLALFVLVLHGCAPSRSSVSPVANDRDLVVLVHGMGRTPASMWPMRLALERSGYEVLNWGYSSTSATIPELGAALGKTVAGAAGPGRRVHFVGHSLGNIVVRWTLAHAPPERVGRVVMLAPPNRGARSADRSARWLSWLLRPLPELRTDSGSTARSIPLAERVEIGIIAGDRDGKVSVAETHLDGEAEHVVVRSRHTFIMARPSVQRLTVRFLRTGSFALKNTQYGGR